MRRDAPGEYLAGMPRGALLAGALVVWLGLMVGTLVWREPATAQLEGVVVARETGRPIARANVAAHGVGWQWQREVKTDARGRFRLEGIGTGIAYISGYTNIHKSLKDEKIEIQEGPENRITLVLDPVPPYLSLQTHQHVLLPGEAAVLTCKGFTRADALRLEVRRFSLQTLLASRETATPDDEGLTVPPGTGELVMRKELPAAPRDPEGLLFRKLTLAQAAPGLYSVWVRARDARAGTVLSVSRLGVITKLSGKAFLAYAVDLETDRPVPGARAALYHGLDVVAEGVTDENGLFRAAISGASRGDEPRLIASAGDSVAFTRLDSVYREERGDYRVYLYTDRPIYRPGQMVYFKGIVRRKKGAGYQVPAGLPVKVEIHDPTEALLRRASYTTSDFGSFHGRFRLPSEGTLGTFPVSVAIGDESFSFTFYVAEYQKPEYRVEVKPERPRLVRGDEARVNIAATYYWGGPVRRAKVSYHVTREPDYVGPPGDEDDLAGYYPSPWEDDEREGKDYGEEVAAGKLTTDDAGRAQVRFATGMPANDTEDYRYSVSVDVTDASRRSVSEEGSVQVARSPLRIFVEPESWVLPPGAPVRLNVSAVDFEGRPRVNLPVHLQAAGREGDVRTDARGKAAWVLEGGKLPGAFQVTATAQDERGQIVTGDAWVWTGAGRFSAAGYSYADLEVIADRKTYVPGDTARLVLNTAHPGTAALLTVEGDELYHAEVVELRERSTVVSLPLLAAYRPDVYVSVSAVHRKTYARKEVLLRVSPREQQLTVQVTADKKTYRPRETAVYTIRTLDAQGRPTDAEASLGLVDESIYAVRPESRYDALQAFYQFRPNAVQTNFSFPEIYLAGDAKDQETGEVRKEFPDTATWLPVIRTGASGRAVVRVRLPDTLTTWRATCRAHTRATQVGTGICQVISTKPLLVRLETPRFFTQNDATTISAIIHNETERPERVAVRLTATGLAVGGSAGSTLDVPAHGMTRADWPVLALPGLTAVITASARGGSGLGDAMQLTVPVIPHGTEYRSSASGEIPAPAPLRADAAIGNDSDRELRKRESWRKREIRLAQEIPAEQDGPTFLLASRFRELSRFRSSPPTSFRAFANFRAFAVPAGAPSDSQLPRGEITATLTLPAGAIREATRARVVLSGSPAGLMLRSLTYLHGIDYGNTENVVGWFLPDMTVAMALRELGVHWAPLEQGLPRRVHDNLSRLYALQAQEGGWGWNGEARADAFWTAYALYGLVQAQKAGYLVDEGVVERGVGALQRLLPAVQDRGNRALALYVLAVAGHPDRTALRKMADAAPKLQNYARALTVLALADAGEMAVARRVAAVLEQAGKQSGRLAWWPEIFPWGFYSCNDNETTGYAMMALIRVDPDNPRIPKAARWLVEHQQGESWVSSEDTASVIYALSAYLRLLARQNPSALTATVFLNGAPVATRRIDRSNFFQEISVSLPTAKLRVGANQVTLRRAGTGPLLYSALLQTYVQGENLPASTSADGFIVSREYVREIPLRDVHGHEETKEASLGDTVRVGDEIVARVMVRAPRAAREVLVEDPIPAGCEVVNEQSTSDEEEGDEESQPARREARDRRVIFHAFHVNTGENVFRYRLRAELPGDYHVLPAHAACAYIPEIWGASAERRLRIRD
jgi:alpha-2-macroglobulin